MPVEFEKLRALLGRLRAVTSRFDLKLENIDHMLEGMVTIECLDRSVNSSCDSVQPVPDS
jgi:hypothetical protein